MAAGEEQLGTAIVEIRAKFDQLGKDLDEAQSKAKAALSGIEGTATLGVDVSEVEAGADEADAQLEDIEGEAGLGLDASEVESGAAEADAQLDGIDGVAVLGVDIGSVEGAAAEAASLLSGIEATAVLGVDTSALDSAASQADQSFSGMAGAAAAPGAALGSGMAAGAAQGGTALAGMKGGIGGLAVAAAGFVGVSMFGGFIADARESVESTSLLGSQLKVTGADAWTSVGSIQALAESIRSTTGVSDEAVVSSAAWLTSFKNIRNEAGEGNAVFDRAIVVATDLSAIMGGDLQGATTQLGKALNDPIKGITALGRAGVQFTQEQKDMIASMVEQGDLLGAQNIILGEVEGQVGGAAQSMADGADLMGSSFGELSESFGKALLPALDKFAQIAVPIIDFFAGLPAPLQLVLLAVPALALGFAGLGVVLPLIATGLGAVGIGGGVASAGLAPLLIPLGLIALAIGAVVAVGYLLITHWDTLKEAAGAVWDWIGDKVEAVGNWIGDRIDGVKSFIAGLIGKWFELKDRAGETWDWIQGKVEGFVGFITGVPGRIAGVFTGMWDGIIGGAKGAFNALSSVWNSTIGAFGFTVPSWIPVLGGKRFDMPDMPRLAEGGNILQSGFALVGERGPEVRWLNRGETVSPIAPGGGAVGEGVRDVHVHAGALLGSQRDVEHWVRSVVGR